MGRGMRGWASQDPGESEEPLCFQQFGATTRKASQYPVSLPQARSQLLRPENGWHFWEEGFRTAKNPGIPGSV
jgi:hypothetical protein